jgi:hypothetical protein
MKDQKGKQLKGLPFLLIFSNSRDNMGKISKKGISSERFHDKSINIHRAVMACYGKRRGVESLPVARREGRFSNPIHRSL